MSSTCGQARSSRSWQAEPIQSLSKRRGCDVRSSFGEGRGRAHRLCRGHWARPLLLLACAAYCVQHLVYEALLDAEEDLGSSAAGDAVGDAEITPAAADDAVGDAENTPAAAGDAVGDAGNTPVAASDAVGDAETVPEAACEAVVVAEHTSVGASSPCEVIVVAASDTQSLEEAKGNLEAEKVAAGAAEGDVGDAAPAGAGASVASVPTQARRYCLCSGLSYFQAQAFVGRRPASSQYAVQSEAEARHGRRHGPRRS